LSGMDKVGAMEFLIDKVKITKSNEQFILSMSGGGK